MKERVRVGIIGICHVHVHNVALIYKRHPRVDLVAVADTVPLVAERSSQPYTRVWNLDYLTGKVGIPHRYDDYREMLAKESLDIVICNSENSAHVDVVEACCQHGVHVCVEKPMAGSLDDALRMVQLSESAGIRMLIHWYMPFSPMQMRAKQLIEKGEIGRVLQIQMRAAHAGPLAPGAVHPGPNIATAPMTDDELASTWWYQKATGGGATIDFCSYGAVISRWFLGEQAESVLGLQANLNSPWSEADDTGTLLVRFPSAVGLFEGSWATKAPGIASGPIVYGSEGTLVVEESGTNPAVRFISASGRVTEHRGLELQEERKDVAHVFIDTLESGAPLHPTLDPRFNLDAMAILDAGLRSIGSGRAEVVREVG